jgi:aminoglycoside phosphotransferase family enzyme
MKFRLRQVGSIGLAIAVSLTIGSCSGSKVSQCVEMIKVVNQTVIDAENTTESVSNGSFATLEKKVALFDKAAKDIEAMNIGDEKLKTYQNQFLTMYRGMSEVSKQVIEGIKAKKLTKVQEALGKYENIASPERERTLATSLTQYCQAPEK